MKNKMTLLLTFVIGAIAGAVIVWFMFHFCCQKSCCYNGNEILPDTTGTRQISVQEANTYFKAYYAAPDTVFGLKAFTINAAQFNAMKLIAKAYPKVGGFRIYMGMDKSTPVRMVVGTGAPDKVNDIYVTSDESSGPCPRICDDTSPITDR